MRAVYHTHLIILDSINLISGEEYNLKLGKGFITKTTMVHL
jgi:hypothetical protein